MSFSTYLHFPNKSCGGGSAPSIDIISKLENIPESIPTVPPGAPAVPVVGHKITQHFYNGEIMWIWNGTDWDVCPRDFSNGGTLTPAK